MLKNISKINKTYRHISRYREIISVIVKYGFEDIVDKLNIGKYVDITNIFSKNTETVYEKKTTFERIRLVIEELGPTFVKVGQMLSSRADLLPLNLLKELEKLLDNVPPFSSEDAIEILKKEFNQDIFILYTKFDKTPIASASIAQVHKAELVSGEEVIVKIQRPNIKKKLQIDLEILGHLALLAEKYITSFEFIKPTSVVGELSKNLMNELDFNNEISNITKFKKLFKKDKNIYVPKVYEEYCTSKVVTMEFIDGIKASDKKTLLEQNYDLELIANRGVDLILKQIFNHGFFHADPHPGNIFIMKDNKICFLDFGSFGFLTSKQRKKLSNLILGIIFNDERRIINAIISFSKNKEIDSDKLSADISDFIETYFYRSLKNIQIDNLLKEFVNILNSHKIIIPSSFYTLIKTLIIIEGLGLGFYPEFDIFSHLKPFSYNLIFNKFKPDNILKELFNFFDDTFTIARELPFEIRDTLYNLKSGRLKFNFEHRGTEPIILAFDKITNRIVFAIVLASIIIGSSLIVLSDIPPKWNEVPIIGIVGFLTAGLMGFSLLISIIKHGKM